MDARKNFLVALIVVCLTVALAWLLVGGSIQQTAQQDGGKTEASAPQTDVAEKTAPSQSQAGQTGASPAAPATEVAPAATSALQTFQEPAPAPATVPAPVPPTEEERAKAADVLDFCNKAAADLNAGWLGQADVLAFFTRVYLGEWQLPMFKVRQGKGSVAKGLTPPDGMFAPAEKTQLATYIQDMTTHLDAMLADYRKLEEYVLDPEVVDNGKKGKSLGASIQKSHAAYAAARDAYLGFLRDQAAQAEDIFLFDHPLKRQIVAARHVFALFSQMANVLGLDKVDRERLQALQDELVKETATAAAPPFPAKPHMERPFRDFVREVERFARLSQRGLDSGYDNELKRALNDAMVQSRENYNAFVRVANGE